MEPIKINVSVELNLSQDVKNFIASVVSNKAVVAPAAKPAPAPASAAEPASAPAAKPAPAPTAKPASAPAEAPSVTIEQVRQALAAKVNAHREEIKEKLNSLGAPSVTKLDPAKYGEMYAFLIALD